MCAYIQIIRTFIVLMRSESSAASSSCTMSVVFKMFTVQPSSLAALALLMPLTACSNYNSIAIHRNPKLVRSVVSPDLTSLVYSLV